MCAKFKLVKMTMKVVSNVAIIWITPLQLTVVPH